MEESLSEESDQLRRVTLIQIGNAEDDHFFLERVHLGKLVEEIAPMPINPLIHDKDHLGPVKEVGVDFLDRKRGEAG
jgi:hypothetical protein